MPATVLTLPPHRHSNGAQHTGSAVQAVGHVDLFSELSARQCAPAQRPAAHRLDQVFGWGEGDAPRENQLTGAFGGWNGSVHGVEIGGGGAGAPVVKTPAPSSAAAGAGAQGPGDGASASKGRGADVGGDAKPSIVRLLHKASIELDALALGDREAGTGTAGALDGLVSQEVQRMLGAKPLKS